VVFSVKFVSPKIILQTLKDQLKAFTMAAKQV
jgi:hypothetical protein